MANFSVSAFPSLTGFNTYGDRPWTTTSGGFVYSSTSTDYGFLINSTSPAVNGFVTAEYRDLNPNSSDSNSIVLRYVDVDNFLYCSINTGNGSPYTTQYITFGNGRYNSRPSGTKITLKNSYGVTIPDAPSDVSETIPTDGKVRIDITNTNEYTIHVYNAYNVFVCSGSYVDTTSTSAVGGKVGFYHDIETDIGFGDSVTTVGGWKSLSWTDSGYEASISYFTSTLQAAESGNVSTISWGVNGGSSSATTKFNGSIVSLSGTSAVTVTSSSNYYLSAYNQYGSTSAGIYIPVYSNVPVISYLSASNVNVPSGTVVTLNYRTNKATSAYYFDGSSTIPLVIPTSGVYTSSFDVTATNTTNYVLSAVYAPNQAVITASQIITAYDAPVINTFSNNGPVCSGSNAYLTYDISNATSAFFDNGIGWVTPVTSGTITIPSLSANTWYGVSAYNGIHVEDTATSQILISQYAPEIDATVSWNNIELSGGYVVSAYSLAGSTITIDASKTYDADNHGMRYYFIITKPSSIYTYPSNNPVYPYRITDVGAYNVTVSAVDVCGFSSVLDVVDFSLSSFIPPVPVISGGGTVDALGTYIISGSSSYDPDGNLPLTYKWYQGTSHTVISSASDLSATVSDYGLAEYYFVVTDSIGLSARSASVNLDYYPEDDVFLTIDAGPYQTYCLSAGGYTSAITLDGTGTTYYFGNEHEMTYKWNITSLSAESWYNPTSASLYGSTVTIPSVSAIDNRIVYLTVTAQDPDIEGGSYTRTGFTYINTSSKPIVSVGYIYDGTYYTSAMDIAIQCPDKSVPITLSATCSNYTSADANCYWYKYNGSTKSTTSIGTGFTLDVNVPSTSAYNNYYCKVIENLNKCMTKSSSLSVKGSLVSDSLQITSFNLDKYTVDVRPGYAGSVTANWSVSGSDNVWIDVNGSSTSVSSVGNYTVSIYEDSLITLSATSGTCVKTSQKYVKLTDDFTMTKYHEDMVKTLASSVVRYGTDRNINLVDYIPDYIQNRSPDLVELTKFYENVMNSMFITNGNDGNDNSLTPSSISVDVTNNYTSSGSVLSASPYSYTVGF